MTTNIFVYGKIPRDRIPEHFSYESIYYENEDGREEVFIGKFSNNVPDLLLEIHHRPYYAHLFPKGIPNAIYFLNFPDGFYHNEALLDLYDYVFVLSPLGRIYSSRHPHVYWLPPWMPDKYLEGEGDFGSLNRKYWIGETPPSPDYTKISLNELDRYLELHRILHGDWFIERQESTEWGTMMGLLYKAETVFFENCSYFYSLYQHGMLNSWMRKDSSLLLTAGDVEFGDVKKFIFENHLFRHRIKNIMDIVGSFTRYVKNSFYPIFPALLNELMEKGIININIKREYNNEYPKHLQKHL